MPFVTFLLYLLDESDWDIDSITCPLTSHPDKRVYDARVNALNRGAADFCGAQLGEQVGA